MNWRRFNGSKCIAAPARDSVAAYRIGEDQSGARCAAGFQGGLRRLRVKMRTTPNEHNESGLASETDVRPDVPVGPRSASGSTYRSKRRVRDQHGYPWGARGRCANG